MNKQKKRDRRNTLLSRRSRTGTFLFLPIFLGTFLFFALPFGMVGSYSFGMGGGQSRFAGLENEGRNRYHTRRI